MQTYKITSAFLLPSGRRCQHFCSLNARAVQFSDNFLHLIRASNYRNWDDGRTNTHIGEWMRRRRGEGKTIYGKKPNQNCVSCDVFKKFDIGDGRIACACRFDSSWHREMDSRTYEEKMTPWKRLLNGNHITSSMCRRHLATTFSMSRGRSTISWTCNYASARFASTNKWQWGK